MPTIDLSRARQTLKQQGGKGSGNFGHAGRPGTRGGSKPTGSSQVSRKLYDDLLEQGGFTFQPIHDISPTTGFMVSPYQDREKVIPIKSLTDGSISKYILANKDLLKNQDHYLGGWLYEGKCYLDISVRFEKEEDAHRTARTHKQIAFFNLATKTEIKTNRLDFGKMRTALMAEQTKAPITFTAPKDKSLEAFKEWLKQMSEKLGAKQTMTAAEIEAAWRKFWKE